MPSAQPESLCALFEELRAELANRRLEITVNQEGPYRCTGLRWRRSAEEGEFLVLYYLTHPTGEGRVRLQPEQIASVRWQNNSLTAVDADSRPFTLNSVQAPMGQRGAQGRPGSASA